MNPNIEIVETKLFAATVADEIVACIDEAVNEHGSCSFALSGGRTPSSVYRMMSRPPRVGEIPWKNVKLFWGDERWVPRDSDQSNFKMVEETLLSQLGAGKPSVFGIDVSLGSVEESASAYCDVISREVTRTENGLPVFDLVLLGIGTDGHTASVFPGDPQLGKGSVPICYSAVHDNKEGASTKRVTLSLPTIFNADRVIFIVAGERKADVVHRVLGKEAASGLPAEEFRGARGKVSWFLDSAAAKLLDKD